MVAKQETEALLNALKEIDAFTKQYLIAGDFCKQLGLKPEQLSFAKRLEREHQQERQAKGIQL